jgi:hypothetical protein
MKKTLAAFLALATLAGCASTPKMGNVMPLEGGIYQVDGLGSTSEIALQSALYSAETTCKDQHKRHVVTGQKTQYKGLVSQDTNRAIDSAAQVVANITGSWVPTLSNDDDHRITLTFKCEA